MKKIWLVIIPVSVLMACDSATTPDAEPDPEADPVELTCEDVSKTICVAACACDAECSWNADGWGQSAQNEEQCVSLTTATCDATTDMDLEACNEAVADSPCEEYGLGYEVVLEEACYPMSVGYDLFTGNGD